VRNSFIGIALELHAHAQSCRSADHYP
jgi:hypothetical protein